MSEKCAVVVALLLGGCAWAEGLSGRIVQDHSGAPVPSADVRVHRAGVRALAADLETDGEGRFEAPGLAAGEYRIEVAKPGYVSATLSVRVGSGEPARLAVRLVRCGVISGRVMNAAGQPVSNVIVRAMVKAQSGMLRPAGEGQGILERTDASGRYRLYNLPPGEYAAAISYGASANAVGSTGEAPPGAGMGSGLLIYPSSTRPEFLTIAGGEEFRNIDFSILTGALFSVSGKVELPAPKTSFWVTLTAVDQPAVAVAVVPAREDGAFRIEGIAPGSYYLFTSGPVRGRSFMGAMLGPEPLFARTRLDVTGQDVADVSLAPRKGRSVVVRLRPDRSGDSACPQSASVAVSSLEDWGATLDQTVEAGRDKDVTIQNLPPGRYQLSARDLGENCYQSAEAVLDLTGDDPGTVTVPVSAAGSIRGRLVGGNVGEFAVVLVAAKTLAGQQPIQVAIPDAEGRFAFTGLPPGQYRIAAQGTQETSRTRWVGEPARATEIEVPGGSPTEMELPVPAAANPKQ